MSAAGVGKPRAKWTPIHCPVPYCDAYRWGDCTVFVGQEPIGNNGDLYWHLSISVPYRYPTWDEIKAARYDLVPNEVTMAMLLPPASEYVNKHKNCFHLHEIESDEIKGIIL